MSVLFNLDGYYAKSESIVVDVFKNMFNILMIRNPEYLVMIIFLQFLIPFLTNVIIKIILIIAHRGQKQDNCDDKLFIASHNQIYRPNDFYNIILNYIRKKSGNNSLGGVIIDDCDYNTRTISKNTGNGGHYYTNKITVNLSTDYKIEGKLTIKICNIIYNINIFTEDCQYGVGRGINEMISLIKDKFKRKILTIETEKKENLKTIHDFFIKKYIKYIKIKTGIDRKEKNIENQCNFYNYIDHSWYENNINNFKTFENSIYQKNITDIVISEMDKFMNNENRYRSLGIPYKKGFLFYGKPGTGKTSIVYCLANKYNMPIYKASVEFFEYEKILRDIGKIKKRSILLIDDIDIIVNYLKRKKNDDEKKDESTKMNRGVFKLILDMLDGYQYLDSCVIIITTNFIEEIDKAIIRPGRVDHCIEFGDADSDQITALCKLYGKTTEGIPMKGITSSELIQHYLL